VSRKEFLFGMLAVTIGAFAGNLIGTLIGKAIGL
jgi:hypothetical protein